MHLLRLGVFDAAKSEKILSELIICKTEILSRHFYEIREIIFPHKTEALRGSQAFGGNDRRFNAIAYLFLWKFKKARTTCEREPPRMSIPMSVREEDLEITNDWVNSSTADQAATRIIERRDHRRRQNISESPRQARKANRLNIK
jgi:hypothetical protein